MQPTPNAVALAFARLMTKVLKASAMREVQKRNLLPDYDKCCASHDFVDANMVMALSWAEVTKGGLMDFTVMNAAWDIARAAGFDVARIPAEG